MAQISKNTVCSLDMSREPPSLAAVVAHEVKNPLGSLKLFLALMRQDLELCSAAVPEEVFGHLSQMEQSVRSIDRVVTSMLTSTSRVTRRWGPVNVHALLQELAALVAPRLGKVVAVSNSDSTSGRPLLVQAEGNPFIIGDERALRQAFLNVLVNACEAAGDEGSVEVRCRDSGDDGVEIRVMDTGPGVAPSLIERVFDPFFSTKDGGSGLGLALVRETVQAHQGMVRFEGSGESGAPGETYRSCCVVWLPRGRQRSDSTVAT